jgi:hypothetical protein
MQRGSYQVWTLDMVIGAAIVIIGFVAMLVRLNVVVFELSKALPPLFAHMWPLLLIGVGILLLCDYLDQRPTGRTNYARGGERQ